MNTRLWRSLLGILLLVSLDSCTKTVVQTKVVDSTIVDTVGTSMIRFVSMFPHNPAMEMIKNDGSLLASVGATPTGYIPIGSDTSSYILIVNQPAWNKHLSLPALGPTLNTFALFFVDSDLQAVRCIDSERLTIPPTDSAYVRFLNGISDATGSLYLEIDGNSVSNSLFQDHAGPVPVAFASPNKYALTKAGTHQVYVQVADPNNPKPQYLFQQPLTFQAGHYYTVRAIGNISDQSQQLVSDDEE